MEWSTSAQYLAERLPSHTYLCARFPCNANAGSLRVGGALTWR
jgi:hypothetical protein